MSITVIDYEATYLNLKSMFEERGLTPKMVQMALGLDSVQSVYKWTNPKYKSLPSLDNLLQLTGLMDCQMEDILIIKKVNF